MIGGALTKMKGSASPHILSIGLGAATIPLWFSHALPSASIDAVDISGDVVAAAPCFGVKPSASLQLVQQDGREYTESQLDSSYDIMFIDAFDDNDKIPGCLSTVEFFDMLRKKLRPGGVLSMNVWDKDLTNLYGSMSEAFEGRVLIGTSPGEGNLILLASQDATDVPSPGRTSMVETHQNAEQIDSEIEQATIWASEANFGKVDFQLVEGLRARGVHFRTSGVKGARDADLCHSSSRSPSSLTP
jgi:hypothetical protein